MQPNEKPAPVGKRDLWTEGTPFITDEEFERLSGGERTSAIGIAIGAASMCWETPEGAGIFDSTRAAQIGTDLARYLNIEPNMHAEEGAWLLVLLENAIPREAMGPNNWEGFGREHAEKILKRVAQGGSSDLEKRHMALIDWLKEQQRSAATAVPIKYVLEQLGEG